MPTANTKTDETNKGNNVLNIPTYLCYQASYDNFFYAVQTFMSKLTQIVTYKTLLFTKVSVS